MDSCTGHDDDGYGALTNVVAALIDDRGTVRQWSRGASELLGRSADEVCGLPVSGLFTDAGTDGAPPTWPSPDGTASLRDSHGRAVGVRYRLLPLEGTSHRLLLAVPADRAEESEQGAVLMRALRAQRQVGVILRDTDLAVVRSDFASPGLTPPPLGSTLADVMEAPQAAAIEKALRRVLETGVPLVDHPLRGRSRSDPVRDYSFSVTALRTQDLQGRTTGVMVLLTDATEQWLAARRLEMRHQAAARIGRSLDVRRTAQDIAEVLVPDFSDLVSVDLANTVLAGDEPPRTFGGGDLHLRRMAVRPARDWPEELLQLGDSFPQLPDQPAIRSLQEGHTILLDRKTIERAISEDLLGGLVIPENCRSLALAPLFARGLVLGLISAWRTHDDNHFDQQDAALLSEVAAHTALSIDNARRYTRERRAAVTLQRRLLPAGTTLTPAVEAVGRYVPAAGGAEIGGDWFDVIPLPSLRVAMVVGDVIGHGLHAAATMGRLRTAVQTLADLELPPDELLGRLDELVGRLAAEADPAERDAVGATCLVALYDPVTQLCTVASAGHPPPILAGPEGTAQLLPVRPGPPLGVGGLPFETTTAHLAPGSWLALYSDGLLGRPADGVDAAVGRLTDRVADLHRERCPLQMAGQMLTAERADHPADDDMALLLALARPLGRDAIAEWEFPADPATVSDARAAVADKVGAWGLADLGFAVELIVSELITNAVRYAGGPIGLRLIHDDVLVCEVSDPSNTQPRLRRASSSDEGGRGLFLVAQLSERWGSRYRQSGKTIWAELALPN
ncbi:SpoIIE family protein phosphatase [Streptomyces sp. NBC_01012]|uniref:SpoIIE family protein phosphatase n=1 Tax=Streptomyces sp. NBC_01012 TaxID=2903717 RepID=UPI00386F4E91|nr:SpoIIE family protein phosphatase [Streptomyces sp. NBC_01012]